MGGWLAEDPTASNRSKNPASAIIINFLSIGPFVIMKSSPFYY